MEGGVSGRKFHDCLHSVKKIRPGSEGLAGEEEEEKEVEGGVGLGSVQLDGKLKVKQGAGGGVLSSSANAIFRSGLDGARDHTVRRVWKLGRHGRYFTSR